MIYDLFVTLAAFFYIENLFVRDVGNLSLMLFGSRISPHQELWLKNHHPRSLYSYHSTPYQTQRRGIDLFPSLDLQIPQHFKQIFFYSLYISTMTAQTTTPHRSQVLSNFIKYILYACLSLSLSLIFLFGRRIWGWYALFTTFLGSPKPNLGQKCRGMLGERDIWRRWVYDVDWWRRMDCEGDRAGMVIREEVEGVARVGVSALSAPWAAIYRRFNSLIHGVSTISDLGNFVLEIPAAVPQSLSSIVRFVKRGWGYDQIQHGVYGYDRGTVARILGEDPGESYEVSKWGLPVVAYLSGFWAGLESTPGLVKDGFVWVFENAVKVVSTVGKIPTFIKNALVTVWDYQPPPIVGILITLFVTSVLIALMLGITYLVSINSTLLTTILTI
jgi:hypothetical protein